MGFQKLSAALVLLFSLMFCYSFFFKLCFFFSLFRVEEDFSNILHEVTSAMVLLC